MPQFLIVYNQLTGEVDLNEFADDARDEALQRRFALEREHRLEPHIEVVLLGARSEAVLRRTHDSLGRGRNAALRRLWVEPGSGARPALVASRVGRVQVPRRGEPLLPIAPLD